MDTLAETVKRQGRLLIRLRCAESGPYEMQYHYHLQGFIYRLLEGSRYHYIHDKEGHRFFCFSNIFPAKDLVQGDSRTLMISSPDGEFISHLLLRDRARNMNSKIHESVWPVFGN